MRMSMKVEPAGKATATVILTQEQVDQVRGSKGRGRVPLAITFEGQVFRTSISVYRGQWMMVVNQMMREGGLVPGHEYDVDISHDTAERSIETPEDLARALDDAGIRETFDALSFTHRKEHVRAVTDAKRPETRQRRIDGVIAKLT